ncbi:glycosyltransferase family 2 protein [Bacteriovoracaceae bacterium]|nr:glycosyltransferase family 2 protein [Bacteriovoracaceae bacterium]
MKTLGIVVPFLNEEESLAGTLYDLLNTLQKQSISYKLILINDGSTDNSAEIAKYYVDKDPAISYVEFDVPKNIGYAYKLGIEKLKTDLISWFPSDGEIPVNTIVEAYDKFIENNRPSVTYPVNSFEVRSLFRFVVSKLFQKICRILYSVDLRYFNGITIYNRKKVSELNLISNGFTINLELIIKYHQKYQISFNEIPFNLQKRRGGKEKALKMRNILDVLFLIFKLRFNFDK